MACRDGCLSKQCSFPVGGLSARLTRPQIYDIQPFQPRISLATASRIQYPSVRTSVWSIACAMRREESVRDPCEKFFASRSSPKFRKSRFSWFGARRGPLLIKNSTFSLCWAQCFKERHGVWRRDSLPELL